MEIILLENIRNLGKFGKKVKVAKGFGRNYLIPMGKAVPASKENLAKFEADRSKLEQAAVDRLHQAQSRAAEIEAIQVTLEARAADEGKLYGSIGTHEISDAFKAKGVQLDRQEILLPTGPIRELGSFEIECALHAEVTATAKITILAETDKAK